MAVPWRITARVCWQLLVMAAVALLARAAWGDLTVESLTGNAVAGVGPFYQDVNDAIRAFTAREYGEARNHLESAKKLAPRLAPPDVMMAMLYLDANLPTLAIASLEKAIQQTPQDPEPYVILAERALAEGRITDASLLFDRAIKVAEPFADNPKRKQNLQLRAYTGAATADENRGDLESARKKLELLIKLDSRSAVGHQALGRVLFRLKDGRKAYEEFKLAAQADKKMPPAELCMASLFTDKAKAEEWMNNALKNSGQDLRTQLGAAEFLLRANQIEEARVHAEEALKIDPNSAEANLACGIAARMVGDFPAAVTHLSNAHLRAPLDANTVNHLALALLEMPDDESHQRALQFAELSLRQNPNNLESMAGLGWINYRLKRLNEALRAFTTVLNVPAMSGPGAMGGDMGYYMAVMSKDTGKAADALRYVKDSLNTEQPFAYRKQANELLGQLSKTEKPSAAKSSKGQGAATPSEPASKPEAEK